MRQAYLIPIEAAAYLFFFVALLLLIPICIIHYRRFGYLKPARAGTFYSFLFFCLCAAFLVTLPLPEITSDFCEIHTLARQSRLIPFQFVVDIAQANAASLRHFNLISVLENPVFLQAFFNFLLLMPLGFYLRYYFRVSSKTALIVAIATTALFEITQITGIYGFYPCPYRTFEVDDLILNTAGAMVGYGITPLLIGWLPDLQQSHRPATVVSPFRRLVAFVIDWFLANSLARLISTVLLAAHPLWLDVIVYSIWFVVVPSTWQGQTLGKWCVKIRLARRSDSPVSSARLCLRYGCLIALPVFTEVGFTQLFNHQLEVQGYVDGVSALLLLVLWGMEFALLAGLLLIRSDHRGLHDLAAQTWHRVVP